MYTANLADASRPSPGLTVHLAVHLHVSGEDHPNTGLGSTTDRLRKATDPLGKRHGKNGVTPQEKRVPVDEDPLWGLELTFFVLVLGFAVWVLESGARGGLTLSIWCTLDFLLGDMVLL